MKKRKLGFTLLELLVVIGIIGVLVSLGVSSYSTAQKKARDSRRKSDLRTIQACMEQYYVYTDNFKYPVTDVIPANPTDFRGNISCGETTLAVINDPLDNAAHKYVLTGTDADGTGYILTATLESGTDPFTVSSQQ